MRLSACLIVKDEESTLERCLAGLRPVADDIVVVDTGSQDNTKRLAVSCGARVFDFAWSQDFSAARNFALQHAKQPWILVCDADEVLDAADYSELGRLVGSQRVDGFDITIRNYFTSPSFSVMEKVAVPNTSSYITGREYPYYVDHGLLRVFRNDPRIRFSGRVHETVGRTFVSHGLRMEKSSLVLHHFGKTLLDREERKKVLYLHLAELKLREEPSDLKSLFDYAIQLFVAKRYPECVDAFERLRQTSPLESEMVYVYLARAYLALENYSEALTSAKQALRLNGNNPLTLCTMGMAWQGLHGLSEATAAYQRAAELAPNLADPFIGFSNVAWLTNRGEESLAHLRVAVSHDPDNLEIVELLAARLVSSRHYQEALPYCHRLIDRQPSANTDRWFVFLALYYHQSGDIDKAMKVVNRGLAIFSSHSRLASLKSRLFSSVASTPRLPLEPSEQVKACCKVS